MTSIDVQRRLLTIAEVADRLGVSRRTIQRKVYAGEIPAYRLGGPRTPIRIAEPELEQWLGRAVGGRMTPRVAAPLRQSQARTVLR